VSVWPKGSPEETPIQGIDAVLAKGEARKDMMEQFISGFTDDAIVAGNHFAVRMWFTCIYKGETEPKNEEEIALYTVKDGKIIREEFFYDVE